MRIVAIEPGSLAARAGLRAGERIVRLNGARLRDALDFLFADQMRIDYSAQLHNVEINRWWRRSRCSWMAGFRYVNLDEEFKIVNQLMKYIKFGYGNVTDHLITLINLGVMERDEAFELLHKYDGKCDGHYIRLFCKYLNISEEEFMRICL